MRTRELWRPSLVMVLNLVAMRLAGGESCHFCQFRTGRLFPTLGCRALESFVAFAVANASVTRSLIATGERLGRAGSI